MEKVGAFTERATTEGEWRPGNPSTGQQATPMLADWFNMLQRELLAVLADAGITPDVADEAQLLAAIRGLAATTTQKGTVEKATTAEAKAGAANKYPDAAGVHEAFNQHGLGAFAPDISDGSVDEKLYGGWWTVRAGTGGVDPFQTYRLLVLPHDNLGAGAQLAISVDGLFKFRSREGSAWGAWREIFHNANQLALGTTPDSGRQALQLSTLQFADYDANRTYTTGEVVRGSDGQFYEFYDRDQAGTVQGVDPTNAANRPHVWMAWDGVKPGSTIEWRSETLPEGYVENDGAEISRADYRRVFAAHGTTHGAGDGSTTFLLPDDRGEFKRGWDNGRGVDAGRTLAGHQMDQMQQITGSISNLNANDHDGNAVTTGALSVILSSTAGSAFASSEARVESILLDSADSPDARTGDSTYPRNNAVIYLTKI